MADVDTALALTSLADTKAFLNIASATTSEDSFLGFLINEVSRMVNDYTGRYLLSRARVEYHDGIGGMGELILAQYPIVTLTSIYDDPNRDFGASTLIAAADYFTEPDSGIVRASPFKVGFLKGRANIKVTYTAGYALTSVPQSIQLAVKRLIAIQYGKYQHQRHEVLSESVGDRTTTFVQQALPPDVVQMLIPHRRKMDSPTYSYDTAVS